MRSPNRCVRPPVPTRRRPRPNPSTRSPVSTRCVSRPYAHGRTDASAHPSSQPVDVRAPRLDQTCPHSLLPVSIRRTPMAEHMRRVGAPGVILGDVGLRVVLGVVSCRKSCWVAEAVMMVFVLVVCARLLVASCIRAKRRREVPVRWLAPRWTRRPLAAAFDRPAQPQFLTIPGAVEFASQFFEARQMHASNRFISLPATLPSHSKSKFSPTDASQVFRIYLDDAAEHARSVAPDCVSARTLRCKTSRIREHVIRLLSLVSSLLLYFSFLLSLLPFPSNPTPTGYTGAAANWRAHAAFRRARSAALYSSPREHRALMRRHSGPRARYGARPAAYTPSPAKSQTGRTGRLGLESRLTAAPHRLARAWRARCSGSQRAFEPKLRPHACGECKVAGARAARLRLARPTSRRRQVGAPSRALNSQCPRSRERAHELRLRESAPGVSGLVEKLRHRPDVPTRAIANRGGECVYTPHARFVDAGIRISRAAR
ncbi:hypothetical protein C8J57DRAFT_1704868 [Mycena rebaudengoi]|nr:hypothetical protein C8J57DRAFT_1704868 [Mycena rebaudengoi]